MTPSDYKKALEDILAETGKYVGCRCSIDDCEPGDCWPCRMVLIGYIAEDALQPCAEAMTETKRVSDALAQCLVALRKNGMVRDEGDKIIITDPPEAEAMTEDELVNILRLKWNSALGVDRFRDKHDEFRQYIRALIQAGHLKVKA